MGKGREDDERLEAQAHRIEARKDSMTSHIHKALLYLDKKVLGQFLEKGVRASGVGYPAHDKNCHTLQYSEMRDIQENGIL